MAINLVLNYVNFGIQISTSFLTKKIVKNGYKSENSMNVCLVEKLGHSEHPDPALKTHNGRFLDRFFSNFPAPNPKHEPVVINVDML